VSLKTGAAKSTLRPPRVRRTRATL
jgi:hypothetical protein